MSINTLARVFTPHGNIVYTANDFRQTLRIVFAGMIALSISSFYNTSYGVFFVVYPIMLLSLVPVFNRHVAKQFIFSASLNCVEMVIIIGYLSQWPVIMTLVVFALYVMRFRFMSKGPLFLFGSMGVVCQSVMLNFMSYPTTNWHTLLKDDARVRHESLLSGTVATLIFVVFQISDLSDSLSALMAGILILFPMHYRGAVMSSIWRVVGVVLGCLYILVVQLILYDHSSHMLLMMPLIGLGLAFGARLHVMEKVGAGVGFSSITTIGIMFGQNMHPDSDLVFSDLYRITSVTFSLVATLTMVFLVHLILNRFEATRYIIAPPKAD